MTADAGPRRAPSQSTSPPKIAVVIATSDRGPLLAGRALPSVVAQTRGPDLLVVVDDSHAASRPENRDIVASVSLPAARVAYLENQRTAGASGSWNTAVHWLFAELDDPADVFVAILDDDDAWAPDYLERCVGLACADDLTMVAADLQRFESPDGAPLPNPAPSALRGHDFLTGNPGIQGSNLFVRLDVLLAAGGFDEALRSTTDRDLCIRIADLGAVRYGRLAAPLVRHYADATRARLSTRASNAKMEGLTAFWQKYCGRMHEAQRRAFCERAHALFDWHPGAAPPAARRTERRPGPSVAVVLGVIVDDARRDALAELIDLLEESDESRLVGLDVVLVEGGAEGDAGRLLHGMAARLRDVGVGCFCFPWARQTRDAQAGLFGDAIDRPPAVASPDHMRRMLRTYAVCVAQARPGTVVWLVDDASEARPAPELDGDRGEVRALLQRMRAQKIAAPAPSPSDGPRGHGAAQDLRRWIERERVTTAEHRVRKQFGLPALRLLGSGSEAVVFTDERLVYKCIDYWKTRVPRPQLDFLRDQIGRWVDVPGLYPLRSVATDGPWAMLTYDYEPGEAYRGGREGELLRLLDGCRQVGIVCNNICPKNLIVTRTGVKLIDYGSDIRPLSALGFEHMARRAFLACQHADRDDLPWLMRRALTDTDLPELAGYDAFRARAGHRSGRPSTVASAPAMNAAPPHGPLTIYVGVISGEPAMLGPLLDSLETLRGSPDIARLAVVVLHNGGSAVGLAAIVDGMRRRGLPVALVSEARQRRDAGAGAFGRRFGDRPKGRAGIAQARTMLQRYLGAVMASDPTAFGWLLDDDMRVDARARAYLPWLPAFRARGVAALIGQYEGASPNPPLNGVRVQLVDLLHNLIWLQGLDPDGPLPDRGAENRALRARSPDYYYDLSRKHTDHLEMPHWLEPDFDGETAGEAYGRVLAGALGVLSGDPLTRPLVGEMPRDPIAAARDSVNRGGCTFVLDPRALTRTPNLILRLNGREARRSDMVWAIINRCARGLDIKAVGFPIRHLGRVNEPPACDTHKVHAEIVGAAVYAALTGFLTEHPQHRLAFDAREVGQICDAVDAYAERRLQALAASFHRIRGLAGAIRRVARPGELEALLSALGRCFGPDAFAGIRDGVRARTRADVESFLSSLRTAADDFAAATVDVHFIVEQLLEEPPPQAKEA